MAKSTAAIEIEVLPKGSADTTVKNFKQQLREAKIEAQQMVAQFGEFSNEALAAQQKVANLADQMDDFNDRVKALNPDKFARVQTVVSGIASGFSAAQGAMALFGSESEDLQKTLVKVQGAMALSQGLAGLGAVQQQFVTLYKTISGSVLTAIRGFGTTLKSTLIATGLGAFIVLLGTMVAYWDEIKAAVSGVTGEQKKNLETAQKGVKAEEGKLETLNSQDNILKSQGKTEEQILKLKIAQTKAVITQLENQITAQEQIKKTQVETAKRNQEILQNIIRIITLPLTLILKQVDAIGKTLGKNFKLEETFSGGLAKLVFDPEEVSQEADKGIEETKKQLLKAKNEVAGYELQVKEIRKKGAETRKAQQDEEYRNRLAREAELAAINAQSIEEQVNAADKQFKTRIADLKKQGYTEVEINKLRDAALEKVREDYAEKLKSDNEKLLATQKADTEAATQNLLKFYDDYYNEQILKAKQSGKTQEEIAKDVALIEIQNLEAKINALEETGDSTIELENQLFERRKAIKDKEKEEDIAREKAKQEAIFSLASNSLNALSALNEAFAGDTEESQKRAFEIDKGLKYAQTIMATIQGTQEAFTTANKSPLTAVFPAYPYIQAGTALAFGLANLKKISDTKFQSKSTPSNAGGNRAGGGGVQQMAAPRASALPTNEALTQERKVYVTEGDISRTQRRVSNNQSVSVVE